MPKPSTPLPATPLLDVRNLSVSFGRARQIAVDNVSFCLSKKETLGLVGSSGAGKSSVARSIAGLETPESGEILYNGIHKVNMTRLQLMETRQKVQIIFQEPSASLSPKRNIKQILLEPMVHFAIGDLLSRARTISRVLNTVGLDTDILHRYPHQFSTGQQQRIAIARALVCEPELLIADEAVSALDVSVQAQILQLLKDLQQQKGIALLFVSHDLGVIRQMADRVAVMYQGQILEQADADIFFSQPAHPYSRALLNIAKGGQDQTLPQKLIRLGHGRSQLEPTDGCLYAGNCPDKMPLCESKSPKNYNIGNYNLGNNTCEQRVRCHLYDEAINNETIGNETIGNDE